MEKQCSICKGSFPATTEYFYKNKSNKKDGLHPYCKKCASEKSKKYQKDNLEWRKNYSKKDYRKKEQYYKNKAKKWHDLNTEKHKQQQKDWRVENKDKIKEYTENRNLHKDHDINEYDLNKLYEYANYSCMYCGMTEEDSLEVYGQKLHKDHAYNYGSDGIDNCVLACKGCNSSKRDRDWDEWYTPELNKFSKGRYEAIENWLEIWI